MRNFLGGAIGFLIGLVLSNILLATSIPAFPQSVQSIVPILVGAQLLHPTSVVNNYELLPPYIIIWLIIGIFSGLFATSKWNTLRTSLWTSILVVLLSLITMFILDPTLWTANQLQRNWGIILHSIAGLGVIPVTLPTAIPVYSIIRRIRTEAEQPQPEKIETRCTCGAVYRSNPLICSECGRTLREDEITAF